MKPQLTQRGKRRIHIYNGVCIMAAIGLMFGGMNRQSPSPRAGYVAWYVMAVIMLGIATWAIHHDRFRLAAILMLIGGVATLPVGLLAMFGSLGARRSSLKQSRLEESQGLCTQCSYDMRGATIPRCPECGCLVGFRKTAEQLGLDTNEIHWK